MVFLLFSLLFSLFSTKEIPTEVVYMGGRFFTKDPPVASLTEIYLSDGAIQTPGTALFSHGLLFDGVVNETDTNVMYISGQFIHLDLVYDCHLLLFFPSSFLYSYLSPKFTLNAGRFL
jgi:hypothetical protein